MKHIMHICQRSFVHLALIGHQKYDKKVEQQLHTVPCCLHLSLGILVLCSWWNIVTGAFVGVSLEGNIVATRIDANLRFYGDPYLTTTDILLGTVERPRAAEPLYSSLDELYSNLRRS